MSGDVLLLLICHLSSSGFTLTNPCESTAANTRGNATTASTASVNATTSRRWRVMLFPPALARAQHTLDAARCGDAPERYPRNPAMASARIVYDFAPLKAHGL